MHKFNLKENFIKNNKHDSENLYWLYVDDIGDLCLKVANNNFIQTILYIEASSGKLVLCSDLCESLNLPLDPNNSCIQLETDNDD